MRITSSYGGKTVVFDTDAVQVIIGRAGRDAPVQIDLTPDHNVSRQHVRIVSEEGQYWIEDLGSAHGTRIDGEEIKGSGKRPLRPGSEIRLGNRMLRFEPAGGLGAYERDEIAETIDAERPVFSRQRRRVVPRDEPGHQQRARQR